MSGVSSRAPVVYLSKKLYSLCLVLVCSSKIFEHDFSNPKLVFYNRTKINKYWLNYTMAQWFLPWLI